MTRIKSSITTPEQFISLRGMGIDETYGGLSIVSNEYYDRSRWSSIWKIIWREEADGATCYFTYDYEKANNGDNTEYDAEFDASSIRRVNPIQVIVTQWEEIEDEEDESSNRSFADDNPWA